MKTSHFLLGVIAGAAAAATAVMFTAPKSGTQLRQEIKEHTNTAKLQLAEVKDQSNIVVNAIQTLSNEAKNNIPAIINELKLTFQSFQKDIQPNLNNLQQHANSLNESLNEIKQNIDDFSNKGNKTEQ